MKKKVIHKVTPYEIKEGVVIRKEYSTTVKIYAENKAIEFVASTASTDRHGDVLVQDGCDLANFKSNPVILYGHDYKSLPIGKAIKTWVEKNLHITVEFASEMYDFAKIVEQMIRNGFLKAVSVGFIPKKWEAIYEKSEAGAEQFVGYKFLEWELLELSVVPIPANPEALQVAKAFGIDKNLDTKSELLLPKATPEAEDEVKALQDELLKQKGLNEKRKTPLKAFRKYLVEFRELLGLPKLDSETKSIEQVLGSVKVILGNSIHKDHSTSGKPENQGSVIRLQVKTETELGKEISNILNK